MKKIVAFNGSARKNGNTNFLLNSFLNGAEKYDTDSDIVNAHEINLDYCTGCLRCNLIKRCSIRGDDWSNLSAKILDSDILVFATPIYFHHVSGQLKKVIDRFRSFFHVQITESGLNHTPHTEWNKDFVLLLSLGSSSDKDAQPVIELFKGLTKILGHKNRLHVIIATRLGVTKQVVKSKDELTNLYPKLGLSVKLVDADFHKNHQVLQKCFELGEKLSG